MNSMSPPLLAPIYCKTKAGQTVELDYDSLGKSSKRRAGNICFAPCRMGVLAQVRCDTGTPKLHLYVFTHL